MPQTDFRTSPGISSAFRALFEAEHTASEIADQHYQGVEAARLSAPSASWEAFCDKDQELTAAAGEAQTAVVQFPVTSPTELRAKIAFVIDRKLHEGIDWMPELLIDAEHLAQAAKPSAPRSGGQVEAAYADWKAAHAEIESSDDATLLAMESAEHPIWQRIKAAEATIRLGDDTGPRVAEIRMWLSLEEGLLYKDEVDAARREDVYWLIANAKEPEFHTVMALNAIHALRWKD